MTIASDDRLLSGLAALFGARSLAIVGASDRAGSPGSRVMHILRESGYDGLITAINPRLPAFADGVVTRATLDDCSPGSIDTVLVLTPAATVPDVLRSCVRLGVRAVTVVSGGFDDLTEGVPLPDLFRRIAADSGMRILGPNCLGVINSRDGLVASPASAFMSGTVTPGPVSIVSQSGAVGAYLVGLLAEAGLGVRYFASTGNEVDLKLGEIAMHYAGDDATEVIVVYLEGLRDAPAFIDALAEARRRGKNVIVLKAGQTEVGAAAVRSHTAALAGDDAVYDAVLARLGAFRARSVDEAVRAAQCSTSPVRTERDTNRIGVVTTSGGLGILAVEALVQEDFELPGVPAAAQQRMREILPFCTPGSPVDLGGSVPREPAALRELLDLAVESMDLDAIVVVVSNLPRSPVSWTSLRETVRAFAAGSDAAVAVVGALTAEDVSAFGRLGVITAADPAQAARSLAILREMTALRRSTELVAVPPVVDAPADTVAMSDLAAMRLLTDRGVCFPEHVVVELGTGPLSAGWGDVELPAAVKLLQDGVLHKAAAGNVVTGISDGADLEAQIRAFRDKADGAGCILVQSMVDQVIAEVIVSARRDAAFGPVYVIGTGGHHVELMQDRVILLEPVSPADVSDALASLRYLPDLGPEADRIGRDVHRVIDALRLVLVEQPTIAEVEVNPVVLRSQSPHAVAVDAVVLQGSAASPPPAGPTNRRSHR